MANIIQLLSKFLLIPLLKEFAAYIVKRIADYQKQKELKRIRKRALDRAHNEQDQRDIEAQISPGNDGEPSGRGVVVDKPPFQL
jgi:hypothetical protein